jgi:hypothetical protein
MTGQAWDCFKNALGVHLGLNPAHPMERSKDLFSLLYTFLAQMGHREDYRNRLSEMSRTRQGMIATDFSQSVPEPRPVSPDIAAGLIQALIHGLMVLLMVDPKAFDRHSMYEACLHLFAPLFRRDAEHGSEPLVSQNL